MNELMINKRVETIESIEVAKMMDKEHKEIIWMIDGNKKRGIVGIKPTIELSADLHLSDYFIENTYKDSMNRNKKCYSVTKMGCELLANKLTGEKGILFSARYVKRFNEMQNVINNTPMISNKEIQEFKEDIKYIRSQVCIKKKDSMLYTNMIKEYLGIKTIKEDKYGYNFIKKLFLLKVGVDKFEDVEVNADNLIMLNECCQSYKLPYQQISLF